ncbi:MAG: hypothetical protein ACRD11_15010 [Terriglobia bacterium]
MYDVVLVCDGSAVGNPDPGGFAAIVKCGEREWVLTGGHPATMADEAVGTAEN